MSVLCVCAYMQLPYSYSNGNMLGGFEMGILCRLMHMVMSGEITKQDINTLLESISTKKSSCCDHIMQGDVFDTDIDMDGITVDTFSTFLLRGAKSKQGNLGLTLDGLETAMFIFEKIEPICKNRVTCLFDVHASESDHIDPATYERHRIVELGSILVEIGLRHYDNTYGSNNASSRGQKYQLLICKETEQYVHGIFKTMIDSVIAVHSKLKKKSEKSTRRTKDKMTIAESLIKAPLVVDNLQPCKADSNGKGSKTCKTGTDKQSVGAAERGKPTPEASATVENLTAEWNKGVQQGGDESLVKEMIGGMNTVVKRLVTMIHVHATRRSKELELKRKLYEHMIASLDEEHEVMQGYDSLQEDLERLQKKLKTSHPLRHT